MSVEGIEQTVRIAMWSGPRNMSTAMMRSFGARADTACADEPFYAAFLALTGADHPMRDAILERHERDPHIIAQAMGTGGVEAHVFYQKHMTHHMVDGIPRGWMDKVRHAFLIRHPARVLASYAKKMERVSLEAIGFPQQLELFEQAQSAHGGSPVVIDSDDILQAPETGLKALCRALGIAFNPAMLNWSPGAKPEDGIWGAHWYDRVNASTGFGPPPGPVPDVPRYLQPILTAALPIYETLKSAALKP